MKHRQFKLHRRQFIKGVCAALPLGALATSGTRLNAALANGEPADTRPTVVVLGAGIAGLSAGYELQKHGMRVTVLESASRPGGRMIEAWTGPLYGPTHAGGIFASNLEMFDLARELGIEDQLQGEEILLPLDNGIGNYRFSLRFDAAKAAAIPGVSAEAQASLPRIGREIEEMFGGIDPALPFQGAEHDQESIAEFFRRRLSADAAREVIDYAINPVTDGWGTPAEEASPVPFLSLFAKDGGHYIRPLAPIDTLVNRLAEQLDVRLNATVMNVSTPRADGRRTIRWSTESAGIQQWTPDAVICALPGTYVTAVIDDLEPDAIDVYGDSNFSKFNKVNYVMSDRFAGQSPRGTYFIPGHPDPLKSRLQFWSVLPAMPDHHDRPPTVSAGLSRLEFDRWRESGQALHDYCLPLVEAVYPAFDRSAVEDIVIQAGDYVPYMRTGFCTSARRLMDAQLSSRRNLYFVGENVSSAHTGGSCASGRVVARALVKHWIGSVR